MDSPNSDNIIYFRSINSFNQKVFPVPIPFMPRMSPKQLLLMGLASLVVYAAYISSSWHLVPLSVFFVYMAAKERKALYPERHALVILRFLISRYVTRSPVNAAERLRKDAARSRKSAAGSGKGDGMFLFPEKFQPRRAGSKTPSAQKALRRVYAAKLGTPLSLEVTVCDASGKLYALTHADVVFDGKDYAVVSDSNAQFEIYPIVSTFGRKELAVSVAGRKILTESFDVRRG